MSWGVTRAVVAATCLLWLTGCEPVTKGGPSFRAAANPDVTASVPEATPATPDPTPSDTSPAASAADVTGSVYAPVPRWVAPPPKPPGPWSATEDPNDKLALGKRQFREGNYGLAEENFRHVVEDENVPAQRKAEAWVGLAASYDRLKRFDLADRAYHAAMGILGPTPEILNNHGFSYLLRGDYRRARLKLTEAAEKDPTNPYIRNNIELLERSMRGGGGRKKI